MGMRMIVRFADTVERTKPNKPVPTKNGKWGGYESYDDYLWYSEHWWEYKRQKREKLGPEGWKCCTCGSRDKLQVHHNTYERIGRELDSDTTVLCDDCHGLFHQTHYYRNGRFWPIKADPRRKNSDILKMPKFPPKRTRPY